MTLEEYFQQFGSGFALLALPVALLGGVVAGAVCPCTLPVGLGIAGATGAAETQSRRSGFMIATAFFAGIVVNLTILGGLASRLYSTK
jgi:cytochrome c-type biogenesis protein